MSSSSFPQAIIHIDGDSFFASCEQALHANYRGKPIVTGKERGIVSAASYEAKALGIDRGVPLSQVRKICPEAVIVSSDYETYSIFSKRMFDIIRRFSGAVEEYSIDEGFVDVTGLRRSLGMNYTRIAAEIKIAIEKELGITVSVGLAPTKVLAKIASKWKKPNGFTPITMKRIKEYLAVLPVEKIWGVGSHTAYYMRSLGITTAKQFAEKPFSYIQEHFTKPHQEIWQELNGNPIYRVVNEEKHKYASISKTQTFTPARTEKEFVYAELIKNVERACTKARRHQLVGRRISIFLKTQDFSFLALEAHLTRASSFPLDITPLVEKMFEKIFVPGVEYRATGVVLSDLVDNRSIQNSLFESPVQVNKVQRVYEAIDGLAKKFGSNQLHVAASLPAYKFSRSRVGSGPSDEHMVKGVDSLKKKHLAIPLLLGTV